MVLDYSASWCGPCRMMEPVLVGWGRELAPRVVFVKCDCEATPANQALARTNQIRCCPAPSATHPRLICVECLLCAFVLPSNHVQNKYFPMTS